MTGLTAWLLLGARICLISGILAWRHARLAPYFALRNRARQRAWLFFILGSGLGLAAVLSLRPIRVL